MRTPVSGELVGASASSPMQLSDEPAVDRPYAGLRPAAAISIGARLVAALPVARPPLVSSEAAAFEPALAGWMLMRWTRDDSAMTTHTSTSNTQSNGHPRPAGPLHRWVLPIRAPKPVNPVLVKHAEQRAEYAQNRIADAITTFAGSMTFVYIHILWFGCWIGFGVEKYPFGLLTMIVSLEAIFLSTFVMISQNRADAKRQVIADQQ